MRPTHNWFIVLKSDNATTLLDEVHTNTNIVQFNYAIMLLMPIKVYIIKFCAMFGVTHADSIFI